MEKCKQYKQVRPDTDNPSKVFVEIDGLLRYVPLLTVFPITDVIVYGNKKLFKARFNWRDGFTVDNDFVRGLMSDFDVEYFTDKIETAEKRNKFEAKPNLGWSVTHKLGNREFTFHWCKDVSS